MANRPVLITGCQRSGTTLLHLILDSHPDIVGIDELDYRSRLLDEYLSDPKHGPVVSLKLPARAADLAFIKALGDVKVLWCWRDARDVVASMLRLQFPVNEFISVSWIAHPTGARLEMRECVAALSPESLEPLKPELERFQEIDAKRIVDRTLEEVVFAGALCWRLKNSLLNEYTKEGINYRVVVYEDLVRDPAAETRRIAEYLGVPWHENMLRHHLFHSGIYPAQIDLGRAIDDRSVGRWRQTLSVEGEQVIERLSAFMSPLRPLPA